jgi:hypothetical protein
VVFQKNHCFFIPLKSGSSRGLKHILTERYDDDVISSRSEKQKQSMRFKSLANQRMYPLQNWLCDGAWPLLQKVSVKPFSQSTSSAASKRNFSTFGFVQSKLRRSPGVEKVKKLVDVKTNNPAIAANIKQCGSDDDSESNELLPASS